MTPDLMEEGTRIREAKAAKAAATGQTESGGRAAGFSRIATPGEVDITHGRILYLEDVQRQLRRLQGHQQAEPGHRAGRAALHHRPQRRRQDHDDGHHHRQDPARLRARCSSARTIDLLRHNEPQIAQLGIGRKFQKPTVFEQLSVFENLELALKTHKGVTASMLFRLDSAQSDRVAELLHTIHLADSVRRMAGNLSHGQKQWLEIGMLLMQDPKLLLLDEPVAGMTDEETARTAELFLTLKGKHRLMVVEHDMSFIKHHQRDRHRAVRRLGAGAGHAGPGAGRRAVIEVYLGR